MIGVVKTSPFLCICQVFYFLSSAFSFQAPGSVYAAGGSRQAEDWHKEGGRMVLVKGRKGVSRGRQDTIPSSSSNLPLHQLKLSPVALLFDLPPQQSGLQLCEEVGKAEQQHFVRKTLHRYNYSSKESLNFRAKIP